MRETDAIECRIGCYYNVLIRPSAYINLSMLTDEEFAEFVKLESTPQVPASVPDE